MQKYIAFEGIDGSGTTTHAKEITKRLNELGHKTLYTKEPSNNKIGLLIREYLSLKDSIHLNHKSMALLFAADRFDNQNKLNTFEKDKIIISDRCVLSSLVYQTIFLNEQWIKEINKDIQYPDLCFYLDCGLEEAISRNIEKELYDHFELQKRIYKKYEEIIPTLSFQTIKIDSNKDKNIVSDEIMSYIDI